MTLEKNIIRSLKLKMREVVIVTGPSCPNCQMLKMMLNHMKLEAPREVTTDSTEGTSILAQTKARAIPVLAKVDMDGFVLDHIVGSHKPDSTYKALYEL